MKIRKAKRNDRLPLLRLVRITDVFNKEERAVAKELVDLALEKSVANSDYKLLVAVDPGGGLTGYICFGPTPMTSGTWDIYWVIVRPDRRQKGAAKALLLAAEEAVRSKKGRRVIVDTSSQASYGPARMLYEGRGYRAVGTVPDYYRKGWHRITYYKKL
ncbi:MAG: GNAT family N-acetyltransferase [Pseudomonadota bacterium]